MDSLGSLMLICQLIGDLFVWLFDLVRLHGAGCLIINQVYTYNDISFKHPINENTRLIV